jgi:hypothetical protein
VAESQVYEGAAISVNGVKVGTVMGFALRDPELEARICAIDPTDVAEIIPGQSGPYEISISRTEVWSPALEKALGFTRFPKRDSNKIYRAWMKAHCPDKRQRRKLRRLGLTFRVRVRGFLGE